jgi:magnesium-transporting ATPase (P-type)
MLKDLFEDIKRHKNDDITNSAPVKILQNGKFVRATAKDVHVGDFILLHRCLIFFLCVI